MASRRQHDPSSLTKNKLTLWTAGNAPTQAVQGLGEQDVVLRLKVLYLLSDRLLAAASFYFESAITRSATEQCRPFFEEGAVLYFVGGDVADFEEHGERKIEKSPAALRSYSDARQVAHHAKNLNSLGHIFRRPAESISDKMVDLWNTDIRSNQRGSIGEYLAIIIPNVSERASIQARLEEIARTRNADFVWEYLGPKVQGLGFRGEAVRMMRARLADIYFDATTAILRARIVPPHSFPDQVQHFEADSFLVCIEALGLTEAFHRLTSEGAVELKKSWQFQMFREFYFCLVREIRSAPLISRWLPLYRKAAADSAALGTSSETILKRFQEYCRSLGPNVGNYSSPLDVLLKAFEFCNTPLIEAFVDEVTSLVDRNEAQIDLVAEQHERVSADNNSSIQIDHGNQRSISVRQPTSGLPTLGMTPLKTADWSHLLDRIRKYSQTRTLADLEKFIVQFPKQLHPGVITMLNRVEVYNEDDFREIFREFFDRNPQLVEEAVLVSFTECSGSDSNIKYIIEKSLGKKVYPTLDRALTEAKTRAKRIVLLDDCIFSGKQAGNIFLEYLGAVEPSGDVQPLSEDNRRVFTEAEVVLLTALSTDHGHSAVLETSTRSSETVRSYLPHLRIVGAQPARWTKLFAPGNTTFGSEVRKEAEHYFREVGEAILESRSNRWFNDPTIPEATRKILRRKQRRQFSIGYGDDQALVVFRYNVPKATVTLLWEKHGHFNGRPWFPLFPINEPD